MRIDGNDLALYALWSICRSRGEEFRGCNLLNEVESYVVRVLQREKVCLLSFEVNVNTTEFGISDSTITNSKCFAASLIAILISVMVPLNMQSKNNLATTCPYTSLPMLHIMKRREEIK